MSKIKFVGKRTETVEQFSERIRAQTRRKILKNSQPISLDALKRSMSIEEPTHLGRLSRVRIVAD